MYKFQNCCFHISFLNCLCFSIVFFLNWYSNDQWYSMKWILVRFSLTLQISMWWFNSKKIHSQFNSKKFSHFFSFIQILAIRFFNKKIFSDQTGFIIHYSEILKINSGFWRSFAIFCQRRFLEQQHPYPRQHST